ncbi:MAG TPA: hypothetical protein DCR40_02490 [Prolixibacteraceae bacterium]|nr:hypothetical protein [Prolixibacteraceae bacterium]
MPARLWRACTLWRGCHPYQPGFSTGFGCIWVSPGALIQKKSGFLGLLLFCIIHLLLLAFCLLVFYLYGY